jgi:hypothetical protein
MKDHEKGLTRRDFLRGTAGAFLAATLGMRVDAQEVVKEVATPAAKKTRVILVRNPEVMNPGHQINASVLQKMLDDAVTTLLGKPDPAEAWKQLVKPNDVVGIKTNVWGPLPTPKELEQAIKQRVMDVGVPETKIGIDDRGVLRNPIFLDSTALINARPLRSHHWAGVGGCIKNYMMFVPNPPDYHPNSCENLATIWQLPIVKDKTRLNILVMLRPLFHGIGPHHFDPTYQWDYKGLLVGTDPVALDAVGLRIFQAKRRAFFGEERPLRPPVTSIAAADTKYHLGTSDMQRIELIKLGWTENILIY